MRALFWFALLGACAGKRTVLTTPQPSYEFRYRVAQFQQIAPAASAHAVAAKCDGFGCHMKHRGRTLFLGNGQKVTNPADLLPVVDPHSNTARYARDTQRARARQKQWGLAGLAVTVAGGVLWYFSRSDEVEGRDGWAMGRMIGYGLGVAGLVGALSGARYYDQEATRTTTKAFESYPDDLANTLQICISGLTMYPCESGPTDPDAIELQVSDQ